MIIKSKTSFDAFDKNNEKVDNVDYKRLKALNKASLNKLEGDLSSSTPFHLVLRYFLDEKGKFIGHFLDFGENKKLAKHFEQVEMKSGKLDKSMSSSPKEASSGMAYFKEIDQVAVLHLEPDAKSKIPGGKWPKIIKELRAMLGGRKAVVLLDGQLLEEAPDDDTGEGKGELNPEGLMSDERTNSPTDDPTQALKQQWAAILNAIKQELPQQVLPRIKSKEVGPEDLSMVQNLLSNIEQFKSSLSEASTTVQETFAKALSSLASQLPKVEAIQKRLEQMMGSQEPTETTTETNDPNESALAEQLQRLLEQAESGLNDFDQLYQNYLNQPQKETVPLTGGDDFLSMIA